MKDSARVLGLGRGQTLDPRVALKRRRATETWAGHAKVLLVTFAGAAVVLAGFIGALNPYGNLPGFTGPHVIMDDNQRYQYPALVRMGDFDSVVIGTSTSRLLDPEMLDGRLGGRFINLALNDGRAWEQAQMMALVSRSVPQLKTLFIGLDEVWCADNADTERTTKRGFPQWMYDDNPWNDLAFMLNGKAVEIAARKLAHHLGLAKERISPRGFEVFVPPDETYDAAKAAKKIWNRREGMRTARVPAQAVSEEERRSWRFPALQWLDESLERSGAERTILAFMPVHVAGQPQIGSVSAAREAECKAQIAEVARRHGAYLIDFRIHSSLTKTDANYWDHLHYRLAVGRRILDEVAKAVGSGVGSPNGTWVLLVRPGLTRLSPKIRGLQRP